MIYGNIKVVSLVNKSSVVGVPTVKGRFFVFPYEEERKDDITDAAGDPDRQKKE